MISRMFIRIRQNTLRQVAGMNGEVNRAEAALCRVAKAEAGWLPASLKATTRQDGAIPLDTPPLVEAKRKSRFIGAVGSFISIRTQCPMDNDASFFNQHTLHPPQRLYGILPACKDRLRSKITVLRSDSYTRSFLETRPGEPQFLILTFCSKGVDLA